MCARADAKLRKRQRLLFCNSIRTTERQSFFILDCRSAASDGHAGSAAVGAGVQAQIILALYHFADLSGLKRFDCFDLIDKADAVRVGERDQVSRAQVFQPSEVAVKIVRADY